MTHLRMILYAFTLVLAVAPPARGGTGYSFACQGATGEHQGQVELGGGRAFDRITGYCIATRRFVHLEWRRGAPPPPPLDVWDPGTGKGLRLYQVPDCPAPIVPIQGIEELSSLPLCKKGGFRYKIERMFD